MVPGAVRTALASVVVIVLGTLAPRSAEPPPLILAGTVVTPDEVLEQGWIVVRGAKISQVSDRPIQIQGAVSIDTGGIIFPGLIDLHNHIGWNVLPRWQPRVRYANRASWRNAPEYKTEMAGVISELRKTSACDLNAYGEIRALAGGVSSILSSDGGSCVDGPVRNLEADAELYPQLKSGLEPLRFAVDINTIDDRKAREITNDLDANRATAFLVHAAEGKPSDRPSLDEFTELVRKGLLGKKTAIVHGTAFGDDEFWAMHELGAALIWSPRSNVELYGETTDVVAALDRGIPVALAPDWALTGSSNLLDELRYAAQLNRTRLKGRLTSRQLVGMVTTVPASLVGLADKVGTIRDGLYADLLVISGDRAHPHDALVNARAADVRLVLIGGEAVYGAVPLLEAIRHTQGSDILTVCEATKGLVPKLGADALDSPHWFGDIERRLRAALDALGSALAPIVECER